MLRDGLRDPGCRRPSRCARLRLGGDGLTACAPRGRSVGGAPDHVRHPRVMAQWTARELRLLHVESAARIRLLVPLDHPAIAPRIAHIRRHMDLEMTAPLRTVDGRPTAIVAWQRDPLRLDDLWIETVQPGQSIADIIAAWRRACRRASSAGARCASSFAARNGKCRARCGATCARAPIAPSPS